MSRPDAAAHSISHRNTQSRRQSNPSPAREYPPGRRFSGAGRLVSRSCSFSHKHTVSLFLTQTHTLSLSNAASRTHTNTVSQPQSHIHSLTNTVSCAHTKTQSLSYTYIHTVFLSLTHTPSLDGNRKECSSWPWSTWPPLPPLGGPASRHGSLNSLSQVALHHSHTNTPCLDGDRKEC